jgi:hypothetical protein
MPIAQRSLEGVFAVRPIAFDAPHIGHYFCLDATERLRTSAQGKGCSKSRDQGKGCSKPRDQLMKETSQCVAYILVGLAPFFRYRLVRKVGRENECRLGGRDHVDRVLLVCRRIGSFVLCLRMIGWVPKTWQTQFHTGSPFCSIRTTDYSKSKTQSPQHYNTG